MCLFIFLASSFPLKPEFSEFKQFDHPASLSLSASLALRSAEAVQHRRGQLLLLLQLLRIREAEPRLRGALLSELTASLASSDQPASASVARMQQTPQLPRCHRYPTSFVIM